MAQHNCDDCDQILHDDDDSKNERKKRGSFVLFWDDLRLFFPTLLRHDQGAQQGIKAMAPWQR